LIVTSAHHDCVATREQLLDLLYDELEADEATALRAAAQACEGCADHLARLEQGLALAAALPVEEPSANFDQRVMAAVHQELAKVGHGPTPAVEAKADGSLASLVRRLRDFVAGPQVAMATLTLLVAALGIWYLPSRHEPVGAAGDTVVALEPDGEALPSAPSAAPSQWMEGPRARPGQASASLERRAAHTSPAPRSGGAAAPSAGAADDTDGLAEAEAAPPTTGGLGAWRPQAQEARANEEAAPEAQGAVADNAAGEGMGYANADAPAPVLEQAEPSAAHASAPMRASAGAPMAMAPPAAAAPSAARGRAPSPSMGSSASSAPSADVLPSLTMAAAALDDSAAVGDRQTYERGLSRYRSRDFPGAIDELDRVVTAPSPDARGLVPSALHHIAQSYRAGGSCGPALTRYEDLLRRFPGYGQAPQAMMEAADCYRRLGQLSAARRWVSRAQSYSATADAARRELLRLDSMESGANRSSRRPANRDQPAAAAVEQAY